MNISQSISTANLPQAEKSDHKRGAKFDPEQKLKLEKAVREFESVFVGYILKSMRNTVEKADNSNEELGGDLLEGMFDVELAKHMSKNSNLGLAQMLYRKMTGEELGGNKTPHRAGVTPIQNERNDEAQDLWPTPVSNPKRVGVSKNVESAMSGERPRSLAALLPKAALQDAVDVVRTNASLVAPKGPSSLDERLNSYSSFIAEASGKYGVSESLIRAVIATESHAKANARSQKDAKGLMQLIDSTAGAMGVKNVWDPRENILGGTKYLKQLLEQFDGDEKLALAGYNAGPRNVVKHGGVPPFKETKQYVARVMSFVELFEEQGDLE